MDSAQILHEITQPKGKVPVIKTGQTVKVHAKIKEGDKERIQIFEGLVMGVKGSGVNKTFTVRKIASGVGVEKTWMVFSPRLEKIEVVRQAKVRRAKLNFVRGLTKKQSRMKEKFAEVALEGEDEPEPEVEVEKKDESPAPEKEEVKEEAAETEEKKEEEKE